jgi:hypothetical protein
MEASGANLLGEKLKLPVTVLRLGRPTLQLTEAGSSILVASIS